MLEEIISKLDFLIDLDVDAKVNSINIIRKKLHELSPFKSCPVDFVEWIKNDLVHANDYNPNSVAPPEMKLLERSIEADGYTQPIVTWPNNGYEVVDGFHRHRVGKESEIVQKMVMGYLPVVSLSIPARIGLLHSMFSLEAKPRKALYARRIFQTFVRKMRLSFSSDIPSQ